MLPHGHWEKWVEVHCPDYQHGDRQAIHPTFIRVTSDRYVQV
jgi:hypothetical protein